MTRDDAINVLKEIINESWIFSDIEKAPTIDACEMAIKALSAEGKYIKIDDLDDTILRLNNDGWGITRNEHKLISNVLYEMPLYSFPDREKGTWVSVDEEPHEDYECNVCGYVCSTFTANIKPEEEFKFCPNCGADMRGTDE